MVGKRISELDELPFSNTEGDLPISSNGNTYRIKLRNLRTYAGLDKVNNTADMDKPVSTAQAAALDQKADKGHTHQINEVEGLQTALDGLQQDNLNLARALANKADLDHQHDMAEIAGLNEELTQRPTQTTVTEQIQAAIHELQANTVDLVKVEW